MPRDVTIPTSHKVSDAMTRVHAGANRHYKRRTQSRSTIRHVEDTAYGYWTKRNNDISTYTIADGSTRVWFPGRVLKPDSQAADVSRNTVPIHALLFRRNVCGKDIPSRR